MTNYWRVFRDSAIGKYVLVRVIDFHRECVRNRECIYGGIEAEESSRELCECEPSGND